VAIARCMAVSQSCRLVTHHEFSEPVGSCRARHAEDELPKAPLALNGTITASNNIAIGVLLQGILLT